MYIYIYMYMYAHELCVYRDAEQAWRIIQTIVRCCRGDGRLTLLPLHIENTY